MEYKVVTKLSPVELTEKVNKLINEGWKPVGSHVVIQLRSYNRFSGSQHRDTIFESEYSQTMIKE